MRTSSIRRVVRAAFFIAVVMAAKAGASTARPAILGEVIGSTTHSVTVITPDGQQMKLEIDSRTVVPSDLSRGTRVRIEFQLLQSGLHRALRITPLLPGSDDWTDIEQSTFVGSGDGGMQVVFLATAGGSQDPATANAPEANVPATESLAQAQPLEDANPSASPSDRERVYGKTESPQEMQLNSGEARLPATAGHDAWLVLLGALSLGMGLSWSLWSLRRQAREH